MANVLVLRKADKTIHIVPVDQEAFYKAQNNRLPVNDRMGLEIMDEEEAIKLSWYDKDYKSAADANASLREQEDKIAELEARLSALQGGVKQETAVEKISRINEAATIESVNEILGEDSRATVKSAAEARISALQVK